MPTKSERHDEIMKRLKFIICHANNLDEVAKRLRTDKISYEDYPLASGRQLAVYTGSSGYNIIGITIKNNGNKIVLEEIFH